MKLLGFYLLEQRTRYLHSIFIVAASEVSFPRPLSVLFTFLIVNCCLSYGKLIFEMLLVFTGNPFLVHEIVGSGFPVALQDKLTFSPSAFVAACG